MISNEMRLKLYIDAIQEETADEQKRLNSETEVKDRLIIKLNQRIKEADQFHLTLEHQLKELTQQNNETTWAFEIYKN